MTASSTPFAIFFTVFLAVQGKALACLGLGPARAMGRRVDGGDGAPDLGDFP